MTVINNPARNQYVAIAAQTIFAYGFEISDEDNIQVYQRASNSAPDDTADLLTIGVDYTVTGVGVNTGGTIILTSGATVGDIVTLQGNAPPVRSTSFTPGGVIQAANLNTEFDDEILIYQTILGVQNYLVPKYPKSAVVQAFDLVLPVLEANTTWVMNDDGDEIVTAQFPSEGAASKNATYVTLTDETAQEPNSFPLSAIGSALMVNVVGSNSIITRTLTGTANQIDVDDGDGQAGNPTISISNNPILGGTAGMGIPAGTTAQRVVPTPPNIGLRFNTTLASLEFYTGGTWVQIEDSTDIATLLALLASHAAGEGASLIGLEGVASTVQDFVEGAFVVDAADPLYPNGIAIASYVGTLLQGHSTVLDDVASGALRPGTGAAATMVLQAYDVDGAAYVTFGTLTSNNTPTFDLNGATTMDGFEICTVNGFTMLNDIDMGSNFITSLLDPVNPQDAATKAYVDATGGGRLFKDPCNAASTGNFTSTYNNGASGVGATLTATANGAFTLDGESGVLNNRYLMKDQSTTFQNGIYTLTQVGDAGNPAILTRALDMNNAGEFQYATTFILAGTVNAGRTYTETAAVTTVGTDAVTFVQTGDATGVTSIATSNGITGGTITSTGTISLASMFSVNSGATANSFVMNASGQITTQFQPSFYAKLGSAVGNVTGDGTVYTLIYTDEQYDIGSGYNTANGIYTAPLAGKYIFRWGSAIQTLGAAHTSGDGLYLHCSDEGNQYTTIGNYFAMSQSGVLYLYSAAICTMTAGGTAEIRLMISGGAKTVGVADTGASQFRGMYLG